jgi:putative transposase
MVEETLAARGIGVTYETVRQWGRKSGKAFSLRDPPAHSHSRRHGIWTNSLSRSREQHWLWRAVDQNGVVLDVLIQSRRDSRAAQRLMTKLFKSAGTPPRVMIADKLRS